LENDLQFVADRISTAQIERLSAISCLEYNCLPVRHSGKLIGETTSFSCEHQWWPGAEFMKCFVQRA
jgi:hypothetical protein